MGLNACGLLQLFLEAGGAARVVVGSNAVSASAEEKRACEQALGRSTPDPDFASYGVWRIK